MSIVTIQLDVGAYSNNFFEGSKFDKYVFVWTYMILLQFQFFLLHKLSLEKLR